MISDKIPSVLTFFNEQSSISTERALKNAIEQLELFGYESPSGDRPHSVQVAIDDLKLMLYAIDHKGN